jgi:hypothetical protein
LSGAPGGPRVRARHARGAGRAFRDGGFLRCGDAEINGDATRWSRDMTTPSLRLAANPLSRLVLGLSAFVDLVGRAQAATYAVDRLHALSDDELAARGLSRQDIPAHVARRYLAI